MLEGLSVLAQRFASKSGAILARATLVAAVCYLGMYLAVAARRIRYPFELEWMEGGAVDEVRRILAGQPLYGAPSLDFTPYLYTPLYFYVSAAVSHLTGVGFLPLRLVSLLSSLGIFVVIGLIVRAETRTTFSAVLAAGLFAACYRIGGAWFDLGRPDSLSLFLVLSAVYLVRVHAGTRAWIAAGVLVFLAFLAKQSALPVGLGLGAYALVHDRKSALWYGATVALLVGGSTLLFSALTNGWYSYYVWELPREHKVVPARLLLFWSDDLVAHLPYAIALALAFFCLERGSWRGSKLFHALTGAGLVGASWIIRARTGSYDDILLPAFASIAILFGLGLHQAVLLCRDRLSLAFERLLYFVCLLQFGLLLYSPRAQIPTRADQEAGRKLVALMQGIEGDVYVPGHGYLSALAGKRTHAQAVALSDVLKTSRRDVRTRLQGEIARAVEARAFGAVILDDRPAPFLNLRGSYVLSGRAFDREDVFWPVTGFRSRPNQILLPATR